MVRRQAGWWAYSSTCRVLITRPSSARARARLEGLGPRSNVRKIAEGMTVPARSEAVSRQISSQLSVMSRVLMRLRASPFSGP